MSMISCVLIADSGRQADVQISYAETVASINIFLPTTLSVVHITVK